MTSKDYEKIYDHIVTIKVTTILIQTILTEDVEGTQSDFLSGIIAAISTIAEEAKCSRARGRDCRPGPAQDLDRGAALRSDEGVSRIMNARGVRRRGRHIDDGQRLRSELAAYAGI